MDRTEWHDLPLGARAAVEQQTGHVVKAEAAPHGVMSRLACTVHSEQGRVFVKGGLVADPQSWVYRHEAAVTRIAPCAPGVLWEVEADGWLLTGYEYVEGRHPNLSPGSPDLGPLMRTLTAVSATPWPEELRKRPLSDRYADFLPAEVPPALLGRGLAHTDMSPLNMLVAPNGELVLLDWALACPGPAWADAALTVPRLISAGHAPAEAETMARQVPAFGAASPEAVATFARTVRSAWETWERTRPLPHRAALTAAVRSWAEYLGSA
ncbi:phosphotransferase [Streptomyces specialis]|uniref:phosphotransferase n=1 Tax=Streptomyces specialis TaxID=498367 RepID=UPI00073F01DD|nr:phosphotransferase [Streptomyces specialis]